MSQEDSTKNEQKLVFEIKNTKPVEALDFTASLTGLAEEYAFFVSKNQQYVSNLSGKLAINEIRPGSIISILEEIKDKAIYVLPFMENLNTVGDFAERISTYFKIFLGKKDEENEKQLQQIPTASLKRSSAIIEPVAKDSASQLNLSIVNHGTINQHFHMSSEDAKKARRVIDQELARRNEPIHVPHQHVLFTWWQAKNNLKSYQGDKGKIESISKKPLNVIIPPDLKKKMLDMASNPFKMAFVVDARVETYDNEPFAYRIENVYDSMPLPDKSKR